MVAMRGMKHPPSYHQDRLRQVPNGYVYDVITNGFGAMLGYSAQIPPRDRWAIVAYFRALQLSRNAKISELPPDVREKSCIHRRRINHRNRAKARPEESRNDRAGLQSARKR